MVPPNRLAPLTDAASTLRILGRKSRSAVAPKSAIAHSGCHSGQSGKSWFDGDFDYNGTVDTIDFNLLATNFAQVLASSNVGVLIPEPGALALVSLIAPTLLARRRRK